MEFLAMSSAQVNARKHSVSLLLPKFSLLFPFFALLYGCATVKTPLVVSEAPAPRSSLMRFGTMPVYFIENRGQADSRSSYYIRGKDKSIYFTPEGVAFSLSRAERDQPGMLTRASYGDAAPERWLLKLDFVGANRVAPLAAEPTPAVVSYFNGPRDEWKTGLKTYAKLVYADLWPGIDLVYSGTSVRLKYEFVVKPGADPTRIRLAYRGASSVALDESGALEVATPLGSFRDDTPIAYQSSAGGRRDVAIAYDVERGGASYGFRIGRYDRAKPLVLDPSILVYSGFIGGGGNDRAHGIAVDSDGSAYVTGETSSDEGSFPDGSGFGSIPGKDKTNNGGIDAFVVKVKSDGSGLIYATFIGGNGNDRGNAIALEDGCAPPCAAYVTGETNSSSGSFPVTGGAFSTTQAGGFDAFVAKVSPDGTDLVYATFLGGNDNDRGKGIAVDASGLAYVTGETGSQASFPTSGGLDPTQNGGLDAFVARLAADGGSLDYSGFIGGSGDDRGNAIALEPGCVSPCFAYVAGETESSQATFPVKDGPGTTQHGPLDGFVAKVKDDGSGLVYAGYIGGNGTDRANGIAVDSAGKAYVTGETNSDEASFPDGSGLGGLDGADQTQNGGVDAFVAKVKDDGTGFEYAFFIGGSGDDRGNAIAIAPGCAVPCAAFVAGETNSNQLTFPDKNAFDATSNGGVDGFVAGVKADGNSLSFAGFIGGSADDRANAIAVDEKGGIYIAGETGSTAGSASIVPFPTKTGPDNSQNGGVDAFVAKICNDGCVDLVLKMTSTPATALPGGLITYTLTITNKGPDGATGVVVDAPLPVGAVFVSAVPSAGVCDAIVHCDLGPLAKGAPAITVVIKFDAPPAVGSVVFTAVVSSDQTETDPKTNDVTVKTKVLLPDLVVKKISLDMATVPVGGLINVTDITSNKQSVPVSPATTAPSTTSFYLSTDKVFGGDVLLNSRAVPGLTAKGTSTGTTGLIIPALTTPGTYFIIAVADDGDAVAEGAEGNNTKVSKKFTVTP
jgi:uncharacterized repeat protein (TIGR01451 family)